MQVTTSEDYSVVLTTTDSDAEAENLASETVKAGLAACVQLTRITSHYVWEGAPTKSDEILMLMKTRSDKVAALQSFILEHHSYDTPEIIELPVKSGAEGYLGWIDEVVS